MAIKILTSNLINLKTLCKSITVKEEIKNFDKVFKIILYYKDGKTTETIVNKVEDDVDFVFIANSQNPMYRIHQYYHEKDFFINFYKNEL